MYVETYKYIEHSNRWRVCGKRRSCTNTRNNPYINQNEYKHTQHNAHNRTRPPVRPSARTGIHTTHLIACGNARTQELYMRLCCRDLGHFCGCIGLFPPKRNVPKGSSRCFECIDISLEMQKKCICMCKRNAFVMQKKFVCKKMHLYFCGNAKAP